MNTLLNSIKRRQLVQVLMRAWLLLLLTPWDSPAQGCCPNFFVGCAGLGPACNTSGFFGSGTDPVAGGGGHSSCEFCLTGCSRCINYYLVVVADCCGVQYTVAGYVCCEDTMCYCPPY